MNVVEASGLGKPLRPDLGAARLHAGGTRRARDGPGRAERSRQDHPAEPGGGPVSAVAGAVTVLGGTRAGSPAALDGIAFVARTPRCTRPCRREHDLRDPRLNRRFDQPYAMARLDELGIRSSARRQAVRRPAGPARAHPGLAVGHGCWYSTSRGGARPGRQARLHGHRPGRRDHRGRGRAAVLACAHRTRTGRQLPHPAGTRPVRLTGEVTSLLASHGQASMEDLAMAYLRESTPEVTR